MEKGKISPHFLKALWAASPFQGTDGLCIPAHWRITAMSRWGPVLQRSLSSVQEKQTLLDKSSLSLWMLFQCLSPANSNWRREASLSTLRAACLQVNHSLSGLRPSLRVCASVSWGAWLRSFEFLLSLEMTTTLFGREDGSFCHLNICPWE